MIFLGHKISARSFLKSIAKFSISSWVNFIIGLLTVMVATRLMAPDVYGTWNVFTTASTACMSLSCLGFDQVFIRFFNEPPKGWDAKQLLARCLLISMAVLCLLFCVVFFFYDTVSMRLFSVVSFYFTVLLFLNSLSLLVLSRFFSPYYRMKNDAYHFTIQQILVQCFSKCMVLAASIISPTTDMVLSMHALGMVTLLITYGFLQTRQLIPKRVDWSFDGFGEATRFALFCWPITALRNLSLFLIPFIIGLRLSYYDVGIYASAGFFVATFNVLQSGFANYWSAFVYAHYREEQKTIMAVHDYIMIVILLLLGAFILLQHVVYLLIGSEFQASRYFFSLVLIDPLLTLAGETTIYGVNLAKKNHQTMFIYAFCILGHLALLYYILPVAGLIGAAAATALMSVVRFVLASWRGQCYYRTIANVRKSVCGMVLVLLLAVSNCIFVDNYGMECLIVAVIILLSAFLYKKNIHTVLSLVNKG